MVYGCGNKSIKFLLFFAYFLVFIIGWLIIGVSLWINLDENFGLHFQKIAATLNLDQTFVNQLSNVKSNVYFF